MCRGAKIGLGCSAEEGLSPGCLESLVWVSRWGAVPHGPRELGDCRQGLRHQGKARTSPRLLPLKSHCLKQTGRGGLKLLAVFSEAITRSS